MLATSSDLNSITYHTAVSSKWFAAVVLCHNSVTGALIATSFRPVYSVTYWNGAFLF